MTTTAPTLESRCELLRDLHRRGDPLLLPNAWDVATARAVVAAGFPVVATTSGGVAATLGYDDHEGAPGDEMLAAARRIAMAVDAPVTIDAEAGYGMEPAKLVVALKEVGAAGCNLEDSDHREGELRDTAAHADWLRGIREAASGERYGLVVNARIDVFLGAALSGAPEGAQAELLPEALKRAEAYAEAGADCVFPIALWEAEPLRTFVRESPVPVNVLAIPRAGSVAELAEAGVARVSWGSLLHRGAMEDFSRQLGELA